MAALSVDGGGADDTLIDTCRSELDRLRAEYPLDAIVLAGGAGSRLGGAHKPARTVGGWTLLDHVTVAAGLAMTRVVVGPELPVHFGPVTFCREDPPRSGPVAALRAGLEHVTQPFVLLLAADLPFVGAGLSALWRAIGDSHGDAAAFEDSGGRVNYLASIWRTDALRTNVRAVGEVSGAPLRAVYRPTQPALVPDPQDWSTDCDTDEQLAGAEDRFRRLTAEERNAMPLAWLAPPQCPPPDAPS
jgi:molybdopterin-guanine dinucleotide biosynthesis protein A